MLIRYARVRTQGKDLEPLQGALASLYLSRLTANGCSLPITTDCFWPFSAYCDRLKTADSVEKVAPLSGLRQNIFIGRRGNKQHDRTVIEWAGATVLLVQP